MDRIKDIENFLRENSIRFFANDNISEHLSNGDVDLIEKKLKEKFREIFDILLIDWRNDHNTKETPDRLAKMFVRELFKGRYCEKPKITGFPNITNYDQLYITGPIKVRSLCAHHFMPIEGNCYVGIFPGSNVIGLSKFNRIVDWICARPQIQEEMTNQIADAIEEETRAEGLAIIVEAKHMCLTHRGYREHTNNMVTSVMRGKLREDPVLRAEFLKLLDMYKKS